MEPNKVKFKGNSMTLRGDLVEVGQKAPDFVVLDNQLNPKKLEDFDAQIKVIVSVPSLDTPVCDTEVRKFNEKATSLGENVKILVISMDLPFAQSRWCGAKDISDVVTLSDYKDASFGNAFGILIDELRLLARAVFIADKSNEIKYIQLVSDISNEPDYDEVLSKIKSLQG